MKHAHFVVSLPPAEASSRRVLRRPQACDETERCVLRTGRDSFAPGSAGRTGILGSDPFTRRHRRSACCPHLALAELQGNPRRGFPERSAHAADLGARDGKLPLTRCTLVRFSGWSISPCPQQSLVSSRARAHVILGGPVDAPRYAWIAGLKTQ